MTSLYSGIHPHCYSCLINQAKSSANAANLSVQNLQSLLDETLRSILLAKERNWQVQHIVRHITNYIQTNFSLENPDFYSTIKKRSHETALQFVKPFQDQINQAEDPLAKSIQVAAAGNIIDFGAKEPAHLDLNQELGSLDNLFFAHNDIQSFRSRLLYAKEILYICDNAGEILFDKLFMEFLVHNYPRIKITAAMRHTPIINDATVSDALESGLDTVARVISSGSVYPGTILEESSPEFQTLFKNADIIISKGQGNFETLYPEHNECLFFLLRIKCDTIADLIGHPKGTLVFMQSKKY